MFPRSPPGRPQQIVVGSGVFLFWHEIAAARWRQAAEVEVA
jgi:hypothetical protein